MEATLEGRTVLVTRPRAQAEVFVELLRTRGARVIVATAIGTVAERGTDDNGQFEIAGLPESAARNPLIPAKPPPQNKRTVPESTRRGA